MTAERPRSSDTGGGDSADLVELGKIVGAWGVRGHIKVWSYTRNIEDISVYRRWRLEKAGRLTAYEVLECRRQGRGLVARLDGVDDRNIAEGLVGARIFIRRSDLPVLPDGEYYWHELIGLSVVNIEGQPLGRVDHMLETGANDVLVIEDGELRRLLPYIPGVVDLVDVAEGVMRVDWQPEWDIEPDGDDK